VSKLTRVSLLVLVVFLIVASYLFYSKIEWLEKNIDLGPTTEVKRQEYLAAQRFLDMLDIPSTVEQGYTRLDAPVSTQYIDRESEIKAFPSVGDLIVISDGYAAISESRSNKLLSWVESGGRLIVTASNPFLSSVESRKDFIFEAFGVLPVEGDFSEEHSSGDEPNNTDSNMDSNIDSDTQHSLENKGDANKQDSVNDELKRWNPQTDCQLLTNSLFLNIYDELDIELALNSSNALSFDEEVKDQFFFWSSNDLGIQIIQAYYGDGVVTFLSGLDAWKNNYIACFDNAYFLQFFAGNAEHVWFLINRNSPSLVQLVWLNYPYFLFGLIIFIVLTVWHFGQRFGSVTPVQPLNRRKILEHIEASSLFLWRHQATRWLLVETVQHSIKKKMLLRNASFESKSQTQQCELIAKATQLSIKDINISMLELTDIIKSQTLTEQNFIVLMKSLKHIEGKL
tara:strand:+ start:15720 stop:17081 length:1362 start_codon:yes stop_codon:yes gene_type:complete